MLGAGSYTVLRTEAVGPKVGGELRQKALLAILLSFVAVLIYLAEDLTDVERPEGFLVEHEEADMTLERVPLAAAVQRVFDGDIRNAIAVIGLLAAAQVRATKPRLRPVDAD